MSGMPTLRPCEIHGWKHSDPCIPRFNNQVSRISPSPLAFTNDVSKLRIQFLVTRKLCWVAQNITEKALQWGSALMKGYDVPEAQMVCQCQFLMGKERAW